MPQGLLNRPGIEQANIFYLEAFEVLSASRGYGMAGALPVNLADITAYCWLFEISGLEERSKFVRYMQHLDCIFLTLQSDVQESAMPQLPA